MIQIDIDMPTDCTSCWIRQNMGCKIANESGWLNNRRDDKCPLKEQEAKTATDIQLSRDGFIFGGCPKCKALITYTDHKNYCGYCGQAVKRE